MYIYIYTFTLARPQAACQPHAMNGHFDHPGRDKSPPNNHVRVQAVDFAHWVGSRETLYREHPQTPSRSKEGKCRQGAFHLLGWLTPQVRMGIAQVGRSWVRYHPRPSKRPSKRIQAANVQPPTLTPSQIPGWSMFPEGKTNYSACRPRIPGKVPSLR